MNFSDIDEHFGKLPADVDFDDNKWSINWGYGKRDYAQFEIYQTLPDGSQIIYKLPRCIGQMLERQFRQGRAELQRELRNLLTIED